MSGFARLPSVTVPFSTAYVLFSVLRRIKAPLGRSLTREVDERYAGKFSSVTIIFCPGKPRFCDCKLEDVNIEKITPAIIRMTTIMAAESHATTCFMRFSKKSHL